MKNRASTEATTTSAERRKDLLYDWRCVGRDGAYFGIYRWYLNGVRGGNPRFGTWQTKRNGAGRVKRRAGSKARGAEKMFCNLPSVVGSNSSLDVGAKIP